jgi:hypothetical protein
MASMRSGRSESVTIEVITAVTYSLPFPLQRRTIITMLSRALRGARCEHPLRDGPSPARRLLEGAGASQAVGTSSAPRPW